MDLQDYRARIDALNEQIADLLCERMDCSGGVAAYKIAHGLPVLHPAREAEVLENVASYVQKKRPADAGYPEATALVFGSIMDASRGLQHRQMAGGEALRRQMEEARRRPLVTDTTRVALAGCAGAFAHQAAVAMFPFCREPARQPLFVSSFAEVLAAVQDGRADIGVLPVENSSTGSVNEVFDLILANRLSIVAATAVEVRHCLMALPGAREITDVYSHHQALSQCSEFIAAQGLVAHSFPNTAMAAAMVAEQGDPRIAAIASEESAALYGLQILERDVQSVAHNCTRFIAISKTPVIPPDASKISLIFSLPHVTGSLYHALARFAAQGLNLTKLESRPVRNGDFEYAFYVDIEGSVARPETADLLCGLSDEWPQFTLLGNYPEM